MAKHSPNWRSVASQVQEDLKEKMVFLAGPRQCGKTTLSKSIAGEDDSRYLSWDLAIHKSKILKGEFPTTPGILVLDELHKYARWRNYLKGLYDTEKHRYQILVTGSAKLDFYRRGGDSLQGRYHLIRMHPLSFRELNENSQARLESLFRLGGFPKPYFSGSETKARRWSQEYRTRVIEEELLTLEKVKEVSLLEELCIRLPDGVGSILSINNLREDLGVAHPTVARWITLLDRLYYTFRVIPFGSPRIKALKKESKLYLWDWNLVTEPGPRFENMMAMHLLKYCHRIQDSEGYSMELRFSKDRDQREVDFVILKDRRPVEFIEVKIKPQDLDSGLRYLKRVHPEVTATLVSYEPRSDVRTKEGIRLCDARTYLWEKV